MTEEGSARSSLETMLTAVRGGLTAARGVLGSRSTYIGGAALALSGAAVIGLGWGEPGGEADGMPPTRLEAYAATLSAGDGRRGEMIERWRSAGRRALTDPAEIDLPYRARVRLSPSYHPAAGYRFSLREGQQVEITARMEPDEGARYFAELYRVPGDSLAFVAEADTAGAPLLHESLTEDDYVLRIQPELRRSGAFLVDIASRPAYRFPIADHGPDAIISRFGAPRDGGSRSHEGLDAIAPRGTAVVAATRAMVRQVGTSPLGGNHVWLRDWDRRRDLYYAHLDEAWVKVGMIVERGQEIGAVGNTGNAEGTTPHLHFGIYDLEGRPADPVPYVATVR